MLCLVFKMMGHYEHMSSVSNKFFCWKSGATYEGKFLFPLFNKIDLRNTIIVLKVLYTYSNFMVALMLIKYYSILFLKHLLVVKSDG